MNPDDLLPLVDAQSAARAQIVERTSAGVERLTASVDNWADPAWITTYATQVGQVVAAGQTAVATLTNTYLARVATVITGQPVAPGPLVPKLGETLRHLPPGQGWETVYNRVATTYRVELDKHGNKARAFRAANTRAMEMAATDLGLAHRDQIDAFLRGPRRKYLFAYRRIIRPELSNGHVCGLCIAASDRIYYRGDLLPIHTRCHCEVMLITKATDPGSIINDQGLAALYEAADGNTYAKLRATKFEIVQHGELGPVLVNADHNHRGPDDL